MWWMPLVQLGMNKMQEKKQQESIADARKQQLFNLRSSYAQSMGAPSYGMQAAQNNLQIEQMQKRMDAERRAANSQMLGGVLGSMGDGELEAPTHGAGVDPPSPDDDDAFEDSEVERARQALRGYR